MAVVADNSATVATAADTGHCGKNFRIFRVAADQTFPVTEFSEIYN
jgi:hypothetical protein